MEELLWFCIGWELGSFAIWMWFLANGLIRDREEYYRHKGIKNKPEGDDEL